jgi:hypothetical protein
MDTHDTSIELGNGWEVGVEIEVLEFERGHEGNMSLDPDKYDPGSGAFVHLGKITTTEGVEEIGLKKGQEIHPAFMLGGQAAFDKLEQDLAYDLERGHDDAFSGPDPYDAYHDR